MSEHAETTPHAAPRANTPLAPVRTGTVTALLALMRWSLASIGAMLPLIVIVQAMLAAGIILGFGLVIGDITPQGALFLSTGAPTILLLTIGLVIVPQGVSRARASGAFDYQRALPVARPLVMIVDLVVWALIALPGVAVGLLVARLRFDLTFSFDWPLLVFASLLVTTMATAVGYAIAVSMPRRSTVMPKRSPVSPLLLKRRMAFSTMSSASSQVNRRLSGVPMRTFLPQRPPT